MGTNPKALGARTGSTRSLLARCRSYVVSGSTTTGSEFGVKSKVRCVLFLARRCPRFSHFLQSLQSAQSFPDLALLQLLQGLPAAQGAANATAFADGAAWTEASSFGHERAGDANHPVVAIAKAKATPESVTLGFTLAVMIILSLLAKRSARPLITPMPGRGRERCS